MAKKPAKNSPKNSPKPKRESEGIEIIKDGEYSKVPAAVIEIIDRNSDNLFHNPREPESFDPESMEDLEESIQLDELQHPLLVRAVTDGKGKVLKVQLIAGERRLRTIRSLIEKGAPCFDSQAIRPETYAPGDKVIVRNNFGKVISDENGKVTVDCDGETVTANRVDVDPTVPASDRYEFLPCKVYYDISDYRCIRLAFSENDKSKPLTVKEEILFCERLLARGMKLADIVGIILGQNRKTNITWVSQTLSFRDQLPPEAFEKLLSGELTRHVAVKLLSYAPEHRQKVFESTMEAEEEERQQAIQEIQEQQEILEDLEEINKANLKLAKEQGNQEEAKKIEKKQQVVQKKSQAVTEKKQKIQQGAGQPTQGHVERGARKAGISPKKARLLAKDEIKALYVDQVGTWIDEGYIDPIFDQELPTDYLTVIKFAAEALLRGERDPAKVVREFLVADKQWKITPQIQRKIEEMNKKDEPEPEEPEPEEVAYAESYDDSDQALYERHISG